MALVATAIGIYDQSGGTTITLSRADVFNGATPKAAIVTAVSGVSYSYNTSIDKLAYSYGAVVSRNGGRAMGCGIVANDDNNTSATREVTSDSNPITIPNTGGTNIEAMMSGQLVADGITFTKTGSWRNTSNDVAIEVILLGGDDFDAWIPGSLITSQNVQKSIPFLPNAATYFGTGSNDGLPAFKTNSGLCSGFIVDKGDGNAEAMSRAYSVLNDNTSTPRGQAKGRIDDNLFFSYITINPNQRVNQATHVDFAQDDLGNNPVTYEHNYTLSNYQSSTLFMCALYMKFDNEDVALSTINLPTTTGTFTKSNYGFDPAVSKIMGNTGITAYNTNFNTDTSGYYWDWSIEGSGYSTNCKNQRTSPTNTSTTSSLGYLYGDNSVNSGTSFEGSTAQRITGGFSVDFTAVTGSTGYTIGMAMGTPAEGGLNIALGSDTADKVYLGATEVSGAYLGSESIGSAGGGWRTFYSDPSPAQNESDWRGGTAGTLSQVAGGILWTCTLAGIGAPSFSFTTIVGKDYKITVATGTGSISVSTAVQDLTGTAYSLAPNDLLGAGGDSATITFKATSTSTLLSLVAVVSVSDTILIDSLLIEEMD
tara:strand:- start:2153 stop:3934 length:1782 start_codon:yes stop_codon:yes gene_type:complete